MIKVRKLKKEEFIYIEEFVYKIFKNTDYTDGILERELVEKLGKANTIFLN
jgi:hypothetical protein